ncbi:hypothetical protein SH584_02810 [Sphingomonas sp. LY29]|uniref:hypothetical protein n=1 Tax=Sphingomonas sp. LY29 TaxID=3095341 RepID=UPI002D786F0F|nr:hypothetical protein [Sphingomonas sp. LY29]WRP26388.1 hypothetical protein SH584_02810 [Sphingomonas sp. LY29]
MAIVKVSDFGYQGYFPQCRIIGQMLNEGEEPTPEGRDAIVVYRVENILAGRLEEERRIPAR